MTICCLAWIVYPGKYKAGAVCSHSFQKSWNTNLDTSKLEEFWMKRCENVTRNLSWGLTFENRLVCGCKSLFNSGTLQSRKDFMERFATRFRSVEVLIWILVFSDKRDSCALEVNFRPKILSRLEAPGSPRMRERWTPISDWRIGLVADGTAMS